MGLALGLAFGGSAQATTINVTSTDDSFAAGGSCTLREAVASANADNAGGNGCETGSGADTIAIPAGRYVLTRTGTGNDTGAIYLNSDLTLAGAGSSKTILDGNSATRVIEVASGKTATVDGLTVTNGKAPGAENAAAGTNVNSTPGGSADGSSGAAGDFGGGIANYGKLTVNACVIKGNRAGSGGPGNNAVAATGATSDFGGDGGDAVGGMGGLGGFGGGIYSLDTLTVTNSTITENAAGNGGPGGSASGGRGGTSTNGNGGNGGDGTGGTGGQGGSGGGIFAFGTVTIRDSVISSNRAGNGGASGAGTGGNGSDGVGGNRMGGIGGSSRGSTAGGGGLGGGILAASATVEDTTISQNVAGGGGTGSDVRGSNGGFASGTGPGGSGFVAVGGIGGAGGSGGGIAVTSALTLSRDAMTGNRAGLGGAGGSGTTGIDRQGHTLTQVGGGGTGGAGGNGGGLDALGGATETVTDTTFDSNSTGSGGRGGVGIDPANHSSNGSGGAAGSGGAVDANSAPVAILRSTISSNALGTPGAAGQGSGSAGSSGASGTASALRGSSGTSIAASIFDSNSSSACSGTIADNLNNFRLPNSGSCPGAGTATQLGPLADNGGSTLTRALPSASPAANLYSCTGRDQRGVARPAGALCDAGAYEAAAPTVSGPSADAGYDSATLHVNVNPNAHATVLFDYGTTMGYGATADPVIADTRGTAQDASVVVAGLTPLTTYHFRARVTNADGSAASEDATFTTAPAPAPVISDLSANPSTFAVAGKGAGGSALGTKAKPVPLGTKLKYTLSAAGTVRITFAKRVKVKHKHKHKHSRARGHRKKIHYVNVGDLRLKGEEGANSDPFSGRLDSKALKRGTYRLTAIASGGDGKKSKPVTTTIHIRSKRAGRG